MCLGNICRSPLAEGILRHKAMEKGLKIKVDSAATGTYHTGAHPDHRSIKIAKDYGLDISGQIARQITLADYDDFDKIYVMDPQVYDQVIDLARNESDKAKVDLVMNEVYPDSNMRVPDPYQGEMDGFQNVYTMLNKACDAIISLIDRKE